MKIAIVATMMMFAGIAQPALAGLWSDFGGGMIQAQMQQPRQDRFQRPPQRDLRSPEQPPARDPRGDGRLTDDERRDLHRDLDRANREIYKGQKR